MIKNALITGTKLGYSNGILTFYLHLDFGGAGIGFGGYALDRYDVTKEKRVPSEKSILCISEVLKVLKVDTWEELPGKYCRVEIEPDDLTGRCTGKLFNILTDDYLDIPSIFNKDSDE